MRAIIKCEVLVSGIPDPADDNHTIRFLVNHHPDYIIQGLPAHDPRRRLRISRTERGSSSIFTPNRYGFRRRYVQMS